MAAETPEKDQSTIRQLRERFSYASREWRDIRDEGRIDIRYVAGDPWDPKERQAREDANRPCLSLDELGQYVNQLINEVRQHKRAIKVTALGSGQSKVREARARLRANLIRQIEYRSNAQIAYTSMFENTVQRSYGFMRVKARYEHPRSFYQELVIEPFENPDMVTPDPDDLSPVGADMKYAFVHEWWNLQDFHRRWPKATVRGRTPDWQKDAPQWWNGDRLQVAEYWTIEPEERELLHLQLPTPEGPQFVAVFEDELTPPADDENPRVKKRWLARFGLLSDQYRRQVAQVIDRRTVDYPCVYQYMTNGIELLEPNPEEYPGHLKIKWPGTSIPIIACYGKVLWVDDGTPTPGGALAAAEDTSGAKRKILSLVRLARDPQMLYCYYRTCEAELVGMTPKTPFVGYVGQFRTRSADWAKVNHEPLAYLEADPFTEATGNQLLPLPQRQSYDPPIQQLEIGAESARRAIQAAMGTMPLPSQAQRQNEKSGKALERINQTSQKGSFHFIDHFELAVTRCGMLLEELLPYYYDAMRDVTVRDQADKTMTVRINDPNAVDEESGQPLLLRPEDLHDVTLSTGPDFDSEREQASDFADNIVANIQQIAQIIGPQASAKLIALTVKLKNVGPIGDQIAETISPESKDGEPTPQQLQQQLEQAMLVVQGLQAELAEAKQALETDAIKAQRDVQLADIKANTDAQLKITQMQADMMAQLRELEVKLEIELAKIGSAQARARGEQEMQQLHHHDEMTLRAEALTQADAQQTLDRQAERDEAAESRAFEADQSERNRQVERQAPETGA